MEKFLKEKSEYKCIYKIANKKYGFASFFYEKGDTNLNKEIFIKSSDSNFSLTGDEVLVKIIKSETQNKCAEGKVIKILKRKNNTLVGVYTKNKSYGFVEPLDKKIPFDVFIDKKYTNGAITGSLVVVKLLNSNIKNNNPEGIILEIIGYQNEPSSEILAIIKSYNIRTTFSNEQLEEAKQVSKDITKKDLIDRVDLRNKNLFTIDGLDAKDLDDAVCVEINNNNYILYVSIADVSHYVVDGSLLDEEAFKRGNSLYVVDRVVPMLPFTLSNGICSLNENVDRLTLTCEMEIDKKGNILNSKIYKSIINSKMRMSYDGVHAVLNNLTLENGESIEDYKKYKNELDIMLKLSNILRNKREKNGSLEFNIKETKIEVDENCKPISIKQYIRYESHKMIEDFMIAANEAIATDFFYKDIPFLYRVHEKCDKEKIKNLSQILSAFGINLNYKNELHPKIIQQILKLAYEKPYQYVVEKLTLRALNQARYSSNNLGHFALSLKNYTHFTSPIRRYSDLIIHRIINMYLDNKLTDKKQKYYKNNLENIAEKISISERVAIDCERNIDDLKKCEYMEDKIGEVYKGIISGVINSGFFVELDNTVEGFVPIKTIRGYYDFDDKNLQLVNLKSKQKFSIGMKVLIKVENVSKNMRVIDFSLMEIL